MTLRFSAPSTELTAWGVDLGTINFTMCRASLAAGGRLINPLIELGQRDTQSFLETQLAGGVGGIFSPRASGEAAPSMPDELGLDGSFGGTW